MEQGASGARAKGVAAGVVLLLVALTLGLWAGYAFADTASITSGGVMSVTDCTAQRTQSGTVTITRSGGNQFAASTALTVSGSVASGKVTVSGSGNSGTGNNNSTYPVSFTTTVAANTPTGTYSVSVTVSGDKQGNGTNTLTATGSVTVTVACPVPDLAIPEVDFTEDFVTVAADRVVDGVVGANASYTVTATDDLDTSPTINCNKASGSFFAVGEHTVSCTATDDANKTSVAAELSVTVTADQAKPVITLNPAGPLTVPASAQQNGVVGAVVTFAANVTDNVAPPPAATCAPLSGSFFAVGTHTVTCNAADVTGNAAVPATLSITVSPDLTAPVVTITPDGPQTVEADVKQNGVPGAVVTFTASATDAIDPAPAVSCTPVSGTFLAVGEHTVTCTARDSSGNSADATLALEVTADETKPVVSFQPGGPVTVEADTKRGNARGAVVPFTVSAEDSLDGALTPQCDGVSGFFAVGVTVVRCTATDTAGNISEAVTLSITVNPDVTKPTITMDPAGPLTLVVNADSDGAPGRFVTFSATATDALDGALPVSCTPVSGTFFPVGPHTVNCSATDGSNNVETVALAITIQADVTAPVLSLPSLGTLEATGPGGRAVSYTATATDDSTVAPVVTCVPASGSTFAIGQTTVNCDATDGSNNTATGSFTITVADGAAPNMDGPATVSKEATSPDGAAVSFSVVADDVVSGLVAVECVPASGSTFRVGAYTVECSATDAAGNKGLHELTVTVTDSTAPAVSAPSAITTQATSAAGAVISFAATASDIVDGFLTPACTPPSGGTFPVGTTTVVCTVKDTAGNTGQASFVITVQPLAENVPDEQPRTPAQTPVDTPPRLPEPDEPKSVPVTPRPRDETPPLEPEPEPAPAPLPGGETATPDVPRGVDVEPVPAVPSVPAAAPAADRPALPSGGSTTGQIPSGVPATAGDQPAVTAPDEAVDGDADGQTGSVGSADDGVPDGLDAADVRAGTLVGQDGERLVEGKQGTRIRFVAGGFAPFSWVELEFHSDPISLGRARADRHGVVDVELTIAADMPEGSHHVVAFGTDTSGRAREVRVGLMVLPAAAPARLPVAPVLGALAALLVLVAGARTVRLVQRRPATV